MLEHWVKDAYVFVMLIALNLCSHISIIYLSDIHNLLIQYIALVLSLKQAEKIMNGLPNWPDDSLD